MPKRLLVLTLTLIAALSAAVPAGASLPNLFPADDEYVPEGLFRSDEVLYAEGTTDLGGGKICVVPPTTDLPPGADLSCKDLAAPWASPNRVIGIGTFFTPIQGPYLRVGEWRLLGDGDCVRDGDDNCTPGTTASDSLSDTFTVRSCEPNCDPTIAQAQLNQWKAWAGGPLGTATTGLCAAGTLYGEYGDLTGRRASTGIQAARRVGDFVADNSSAKTGSVQAVLQEGGKGLAFKRQTLAELSVVEYIEGELEGLRSAYNDAIIGIGTDIACKQKEMLADIVADPPDPNYDTVAQPVFEEWPSTFNALGDELVDAFETFNAFGRAQRIAAERYQGALADNDDAGMHRQALAVQNFGDQIVIAMRCMTSALRRYQYDLNGSAAGTTPLINQANKDLILDLYQRIRTSGFNPSEQAQLDALGLTPAMIAEFKKTFDKDMTALPVNTSIAGVVGQLESALRANEAGVQAFNNAANNAAIASNSAPSAGFTANKTTGKAPLPVNFADTSTDPDGDTVTATWDWGDGTPAGAGLSPSHTFTAPGTYIVTETVTDGADSSTATKLIKVIAPTPPEASFTYIKAGNDVHVDGSESSDPDGTVEDYDWDWGDGSPHGSGETAEHTYAAGPPKTYTITLTVTDDDNTEDTFTRDVEIGGNDKPIARFTVTNVDKGFVELTGAPSSDPDGTVDFYAWDFGDGITYSNSSAPATSHYFPADGTYTVRLTVTDNGGKTDFVEHQVTVDVNDAPTANDNSYTVAGVDGFAVMNNDTDQENEDIELTDYTQPEHGTVECKPLGGCLYRAANGYTGPDSFQYTITDPSGASDSATVTINVTPKPSAVGALVALDDDLSVRSPDEGTVDVLANDVSASTPLHVESETQPSHGTVTCDHTNYDGPGGADGTCTYTPEADYEGGDGFTYTVRDNANQARTATVRVIVADADTSVGVEASGAPDPVTQGDEAQWKVAAKTSPGEISGEALRGIEFPGLSATLSGPHTLVPDSVSTAKGWSTPGLGGTTTAPGPNALLGEATSAVIPKPTVINQGTGGDGDVPILVGTKVFAFFHHSTPTSVTCVDRATGQLCPGYPRQVTRASGNNNGPGVVVGSKIYTHLVGYYGLSQRGEIALYCWDAAKDEPCGVFVMARTKNGGEGASAPRLVDGKIWVAGDNAKFYCLDPDTGEPCEGGPVDSGLPNQNYGEYDLVTHDTRLYATRYGSGLVGCMDTATHAPCEGWDTAKDIAGRYDLMNHYDVDGSADGICAVSPGYAKCMLDSDPDLTHAFELPNFIGGWDYYWDITQEAETGDRTFHPSNSNGLYCWDWTVAPLGAACTGSEFSSPGVLSGAGIDRSYGAVFDGTCIVALGDPGNVFTVDQAGRRPCTSLSTGARRTIDLRDQRCDGSVGNAAWRRVQLTDAEDGDFDVLEVIVRDAETGEVLRSGDIVEGPLNLAGIDPALHPRITIDSSGKSASGNPAWTDSIYPRIDVVWVSDPKQLCFQTTTVKDCLGPLTPLSITATLGAGLATDETSVALKRADCPPVAGRGEQTFDELTALDLTVEANDPNGGAITYSLVNPPPGLTIDPETGELSWTPTEAQGPGDYEVTYKATDGPGEARRAAGGQSTTDTVVLHVNEVNTAPELAAVADRTAKAGDAVTVPLSATDADKPDNQLTYSLVSGPAGAVVDTATGVVTWTAAGTGPQGFTVKVTDDGTPALSAERSFTVTLPGPATPTPTPSPQPSASPSPSPTPSGGGTANEVVLGCADRRVVLEDVVPAGRRVKLIGVADRSFAGQTVTIVFGPKSKKVATATVQADGSFATSAPLPPAKIRRTNAARYQARVGGQSSLALKLLRRMRITTITASGGVVRIKGRVELPLAIKAKDRVIKLQQVVNCKQAETIKRLKPRSNGAFSVSVPAPSGQRAAVYRLQTRVKRNRKSKRIVNTFTLPRAVDFG